jgi:sugar/nucleoside kinase (ribokinase family)
MSRVSAASSEAREGQGAIDYLVVGHLTLDLMPDGPQLGGTAAYAGLMAQALGLRVGLVTACRADIDLAQLTGISVACRSSSHTTTFQNTASPTGRRQTVSARADDLRLDLVPSAWRTARIVHLAPVADEVPRDLALAFPQSFVGMTPQGWWRARDDEGRVTPMNADEALARLPAAQATVFSREDLDLSVSGLGSILRVCPIVAITDGPNGADVYAEEGRNHIPAPITPLADDTGSGDIFAAVFFARLAEDYSVADAAQEAVRWASASVAHQGLAWLHDPEQLGLAAEATGR